MPSIAGVYEIRNLVNGKRYIGQSCNISQRWRDHRAALNAKRSKHRILQYAWNKYGAASFVFAVLEIVEDPRHLRAREQFWFQQLKPEYVRQVDVGTPEAYRHSAETRARISTRQRGRALSLETCRRIAEANLTWERSPEHLAALRAGWQGQHHSAESRERIGAGNRGRTRRAGTGAAISAAKKASPNTLAAVQIAAQVSAANRRGIPISETHRANVAAALTGRSFTEEHRASLRAAWVRRKARPKQ